MRTESAGDGVIVAEAKYRLDWSTNDDASIVSKMVKHLFQVAFYQLWTVAK